MAVRRLSSAAVVGWTGRGTLADLRSSIEGALGAMVATGSLRTAGDCLVVVGPEPAAVASALRYSPGVAWIAVGMAARSLGEAATAARVLARRYVRPSSRFSVIASGGDGLVSSDVAGVVISAVLEASKGARVDQGKPQVVIRAPLSPSGGAVGVEIASGPGGVPAGSRWATCLASGGLHSSVLCWMALLSGYRLKILHAKAEDDSLAAVAKLYAELSHRVDPKDLTLEVLEGDDPGAMVGWAVRRQNRPIFAGFHPACGPMLPSFRGVVEVPLYLAPEEWFQAEFSRLSLAQHREMTAWGRRAKPPRKVGKFGGARADVNQVLDGLRVRHG